MKPSSSTENERKTRNTYKFVAKSKTVHLQKQLHTGVLFNSRSEKFRENHRKIPEMEPFSNQLVRPTTFLRKCSIASVSLCI